MPNPLPSAFSKTIQERFDAWLAPSTWDSGHSADEHRFYDFVWQVAQRSRGSRPHQAEVARRIIEAKGGAAPSESFVERAREWGNLYETLYEFAKARNRRHFMLPHALE